MSLRGHFGEKKMWLLYHENILPTGKQSSNFFFNRNDHTSMKAKKRVKPIYPSRPWLPFEERKSLVTYTNSCSFLNSMPYRFPGDQKTTVVMTCYSEHRAFPKMILKIEKISCKSWLCLRFRVMFLIKILQITGFCFFAISYPDLTLQPLGRGRSGYKVSPFLSILSNFQAHIVHESLVLSW